MWPKRKPKNRRFERDYVLDVKLRSDQIRAGRLRMAGIALSIVAGLAVAAGIFWRGGDWLLNRFIYQNEAFAVREIDVQTDGIIAPEQFKRWAMIPPDANLLGLDILRVKRDLELIPLVRSASVERVLPHTLRIRIGEREPVAQVVVPERSTNGLIESALYHLDQEGYVMAPFDPRLRSATPAAASGSESFPAISGLGPGQLRLGKRIESVQVRAALELIAAFDQSPMTGLVEIQRIDVGTPEVLEVYTTQGTEIIFGLNNLNQQLARWRLAHDYFLKQGQIISAMDLSVSNNVPVRPVLASTVPAVTPKPLKPPRNRKRNV